MRAGRILAFDEAAMPGDAAAQMPILLAMMPAVTKLFERTGGC